jgi:hypothetical protein
VDRFYLAPVYPNPAKVGTRLSYVLPVGDHVDLAIYDASGRLVSALTNGAKGAGVHDVRWDGRDQSGREVASGIYFARLRTGELAMTRQFTVLR